MIRHVLRNLVSPILVQATFIFAYAMLAEASLSFLGVGVSPEVPTWGTMIAAGRQYVGSADWMTLFPASPLCSPCCRCNSLAMACAIFSTRA